MFSTKMNRRDFLKAALVGGVALGSAPLLNACVVPTTTTTEEEAITLRMWGNHPEWKDPLLEALSFFEEDTGYNIELEPKPGAEYVQLLNAAFQAGEGPDLPGVVPGPLLDEFLENGYILDLTGKIHDERLIDVTRKRVIREGGAVAGAPFGMWTVGMYYHKPVFAELGLEIPRTWDALSDVSKELQAAGYTPLMQAAKSGVIPSFYYLGFTGTVLGPDGYDDLLAGKRKLTDPDVVAAVEYLMTLVPYFPEGFASIDYADGKAQFARGDIAMALGGSADYAGYKEVNPDVDLDFFAFPAPSATEGVTTNVTGQDLVYGVNAESKYIDEAIQFVDWLTLPEANQEFTDRIQLPTVKGVVPKNPMWARQVEEGENQIPFMREMVELAPVWNVLTQHMQTMLLGEMSVEELSNRAQEEFAAG
jgi:raffinose/stachyose/melibiose transport system substrate-binding protein